MISNLLASSMTFADKITMGAFTFFLGMLVIFSGVAVLVASITIVGKIVSKSDEKKEEKPVVVETASQPQIEESMGSDEIPEDIKVAIIAAVTAYYTDSGARNEFKVRKIKKI